MSQTSLFQSFHTSCILLWKYQCSPAAERGIETRWSVVKLLYRLLPLSCMHPVRSSNPPLSHDESLSKPKTVCILAHICLKMAGGSFISHDFVLSGISGLSLYLDGKICIWVWESMEVIKSSLIHRLSPHANKWKARRDLHGNEARSSPSPVRCVHIVYLVCSFKKKGMQKSALPGMSSFVLQDWMHEEIATYYPVWQ